MITGADVISPKGRIQRIFFPELSEPGSLEAHLEVYIADAYARGATDENAALWAYHRAYTELYERLTFERPDDSTVGPIAEKFSESQRVEFGRLAEQFKAEFSSSGETPSPVSVRPSRSTSVPTRLSRW